MLYGRERELQDRLSCIRRRLEEFPGDAFLGDCQVATSVALTHLQEEKSEFTYHASVCSLILKADRMNKEFFSCFRERPLGSTLRAVCDISNCIHTEPDEVLEIAFSFYESLFMADALTPEVITARDEVWSFVRPVVSEDLQRSLLMPFSIQEIHDAVRCLDGASCLGDDGLTRQFFLQHWDLISEPLRLGFQHIFDSGSMPPSLSASLISLIPKGGDTSSLCQWRPITLVPSVYKILARMLSVRLRPFLPDLIHSS